MDKFDFMKTCLKKFNYPSILTIQEDEIVSIFSTSNRVLLVRWILRETDDELETFLVNATKEELAELVTCHGFCPEEKSLQFVKGEGGVVFEMEILYKMFVFLNDIREAKAQNYDAVPVVDLDQVEIIVSQNPNLFPEKGAYIKLTPERRQAKTIEYEQEIEQLKQLIASHQGEKDDVESLNKRQLDAMQVFNENITDAGTKIHKMVNKWKEQIENNHNRPKIGLSVEYLKRCRENYEQTFNFIRNLNSLDKLQKLRSCEVLYEGMGEKLMISQLLELLHDIPSNNS